MPEFSDTLAENWNTNAKELVPLPVFALSSLEKSLGMGRHFGIT